jgi:hypothetical protein
MYTKDLNHMMFEYQTSAHDKLNQVFGGREQLKEQVISMFVFSNFNRIKEADEFASYFGFCEEEIAALEGNLEYFTDVVQRKRERDYVERYL